ncbi:reverse transcriptase domain-containing protein [Tanacetum coccineum]
MEALTIKIDSHLNEMKREMKEIRDGCTKCGGPHPSWDYDDKLMGGPKEEVNYAYGGYVVGDDVSRKLLRLEFVIGETRQTRAEKLFSNRDDTNSTPPTPKEIQKLISKKPCESSWSLKNHQTRVAENMLVQVGQFIFLIDFVILEMEEDSKVPLILGRPFLHTANAIIYVKCKELNLEVGNEKITFMINKAMQHSHSNDDTCFNIDVIDEVTEEELDALLNDSGPFMSTSEKINETDLDREFVEFMEVKFEEAPDKEVDEYLEELSLEERSRIKKSIQVPPTDLEMKPLPDHLEI